METKSSVFIVNTGARIVSTIQEDLLAFCKKHAITIKLVDASKVIPTIEQSSNYARIIIGGGDGTICSAAKQVMNSKQELGIVPLGTTNNIAKSLSVPLDWQQALLGALEWQAIPTSVGSVNQKIFLNTATIGVSVTIAQHVEPQKKRYFGRLAYPLTALKHIGSVTPFTYTLHQGTETQSGKTYQLLMSNGRYMAGLPLYKEELAPNTLRVFSVATQGGKLHHIKNMAAVFLGLYRNNPKVIIKDVTAIEITTSPTQQIELDGEVQTSTPAQIRCIAQALSIALPSKQN